MFAQARATFAVHRLVLVLCGLGLVAVALVAVFYTVRMREMASIPACAVGPATSPSPRPGTVAVGPGVSAACEAAMNSQAALFHDAENAQSLLLGMPIILGLLVGVGLVATEIEHHTAAIAWSLAISRTRWLVGRVLPIGLGLVALLAVLAVLGVALEGAQQPSMDPLRSFVHYENRGVILVARGVVAFSIAVFIGAVVGRSLPAFILAGFVTILVIGGLEQARHLWVSNLAVVETDPFGAGSDTLWLEQLAVLPSGEVRPLTWVNVDYSPETGELVGPGLPSGTRPATRVVPGNRRLTVEAAESGALFGIAAVALAGTALVVRRRRPE